MGEEFVDALIEKQIAEYQDEVRRCLAGLKGPGMTPDEMLPYWEGHRPRFDLQVRWWMQHLAREKIESVLDVGTGFPFATMYFGITENADVEFGCPVESMAAPDHTRYTQMNLCRPLDVEPADLVVCTECLEHLPCNLYAARNRLMVKVKRGGFLVLSFPLGGANAHDYHFDNPAFYDQISGPHIREFTRETMGEFVRVIGWPVVAEEFVFTSAYGGTIGHVMLRRTE